MNQSKEQSSVIENVGGQLVNCLERLIIKVEQGFANIQKVLTKNVSEKETLETASFNDLFDCRVEVFV